ncbi:hypothetical protein GCK72_023991 [Caenorhabditis remanei]|uniref:Uncharacterized protein n=1 Tax=Caenorhabditis remanei TaxID=31234 RepID=A0A6A5FY36_CAERE|nr:hypothetical protein GCK72_023991 [Caenorhabditis remanei]KAF1747526.1 hypothetical protein GCK72_023991 [Caenorhabditis remanei]
MGLASCKPERDAERQNRQIESQIRMENQANKRKVKMLLLGISDSGKSTIVKQMRFFKNSRLVDKQNTYCRVNYLDGFNETEVVNAIFVIRNNIIDAFKNISNIILHSDINVHPDEKECF